MQRTDLQNKSMHKYFELLARELNDAGFTQDVLLTNKLVSELGLLLDRWGRTPYAHELQAVLDKCQPRLHVSWTKESVKETWRTIQIAMTGKESTTELTTGETCRVYQDFDARIAEITGVHVEWPAEDKSE